MSDSAIHEETIRACRICGLAQRVPALNRREIARCARCTARLPGAGSIARNSLAAASALAGLILYPLGVLLPIMRLERMGHHNETSILDGTITLLSKGHIWVGVVVLVCSVILPALKLIALIILTTGNPILRRSHRASIHRAVEFTGRWGMLDVLAVAVLIAAVKLGETIEITPGPGAAAFTAVVVLSLHASACFDPAAIWEQSGGEKK
jgi:paraquat-inducible protein A